MPPRMRRPLQDLRITSYHHLFEPGVRLPPSLTALALGREVVSGRDLGAPLPQLMRGGARAGH